MSVLKIFVFTILLAGAVVFFTLYRNGANLSESPGAMKRLGIFLSQNSAATSDEHPLKELRTPIFDMDEKLLYQQVLDAAAGLGWVVQTHDSDALDANFIVSSPIFLLEDDLYVQVKPINENQASLLVQSSSRSGGADFSANSGHIQKLVKRLKTY